MTRDERPTLPAPRKVPAGRQRTMPGSRAAAATGATEPGVDVSSSAPPSRDWGPTRSAACATIGPACIIALAILAIAPQPAQAQLDKFPEGIISKIEFEGNNTIPPETIKPKLLSQVGKPLSHDKIEADLKTLMKTKLFSEVTWYLEEARPRAGNTS